MRKVLQPCHRNSHYNDFCILELYDKHNQSDEGDGEEFPASVEELDPETKPEVKPEEESSSEVSQISEGVEKIEISNEQKAGEEAKSKE